MYEYLIFSFLQYSKNFKYKLNEKYKNISDKILIQN